MTLDSRSNVAVLPHYWREAFESERASSHRWTEICWSKRELDFRCSPLETVAAEPCLLRGDDEVYPYVSGISLEFVPVELTPSLDSKLDLCRRYSHLVYFGKLWKTLV